jgi:hypothetical protein
VRLEAKQAPSLTKRLNALFGCPEDLQRQRRSPTYDKLRVGPLLGALRRQNLRRPLPALGRSCNDSARGKSRNAQRLAASQQRLSVPVVFSTTVVFACCRHLSRHLSRNSRIDRSRPCCISRVEARNRGRSAVVPLQPRARQATGDCGRGD